MENIQYPSFSLRTSYLKKIVENILCYVNIYFYPEKMDQKHPLTHLPHLRPPLRFNNLSSDVLKNLLKVEPMDPQQKVIYSDFRKGQQHVSNVSKVSALLLSFRKSPLFQSIFEVSAAVSCLVLKPALSWKN